MSRLIAPRYLDALRADVFHRDPGRRSQAALAMALAVVIASAGWCHARRFARAWSDTEG